MYFDLLPFFFGWHGNIIFLKSFLMTTLKPLKQYDPNFVFMLLMYGQFKIAKTLLVF